MLRSFTARQGIILGLVGACVATSHGCGGTAEPLPEYPPMESVSVEATAPEPAEEPEPEAPSEPPPPPVQVVSASRTPIEGPLPQLQLQSPRMNQRLRGEVQVRAMLKNWSLSADGNHVHLIIDNQPYIALRDLSKPIQLNRLYQETFGEALGEGSHVIRMFPSRPHHESVKEGTPFALAVFHLGKPSDDFAFDPKAPLLTYSRPKGCYPVGERVLLDFYVTNIELGDQARVQYALNGALSGVITEWAPHYIENLPEGEHRVRLALVDGQGEPIPGLFNDTIRTIRVAQSCDPAPAPSAPADHTGH